MATVIDSLVIELGLDPKNFTKGQKTAGEAFLKTKDQAVKSSKEIEEASQKAADGIGRIAKEALALFAIFTGARSIKDFVSDLIGADAALGRFSANLGQSPQMISAWGMAAERLGGSAQATQQTFERLGKAFYNLRFNGQAMPKEFYQLQAASGKFISTGGDFNRTLGDTAVALKKVYDANPARAHFLAEGLGIDEGTANLMFKFGSSAQAFAAALQRLAPTAKDIAASQDLQEHWVALTQTATNLADTIIRTLEPAISPILASMSDWIEKNRDWLASEVSTKVKEFATWIQTINWHEIGAGVGTFATELGKVATALEIIAGLMVANKFAGGIKSLFGGGGGALGGGGGLGGLTLGGLLLYYGDKAEDYLFNKKLPHQTSTAGGAPYDPQAEYNLSPWQRLQRMLGGYTSGPNTLPSHPHSLTPAPGHGNVGGAGTTSVSPYSPIGIHPKNGETTVDGKPVSKSNPMPVTVTDGGSSGSGGGFWDSVKSFFGVGSAGASTLPPGLVHKSSYRVGGGASAGGGSTAPAAPGSASGTVSLKGTNKEVADYIRSAAIARGIDPNIALRVAGHEGLKGYDPTKADRGGDAHSSFGPFQLHMGGISSAMPHSGLGDEFRKATGLDPRNPSTWKAQVDFALAWAKRHGWGAWMGARAEGIYGFRGIGKQSSLTPPTGAHLSAALSTIQQTRNVTTSSTSNDVRVGAINIQTAATDSDGIASSINASLSRSFAAMPANYGLV